MVHRMIIQSQIQGFRPLNGYRIGISPVAHFVEHHISAGQGILHAEPPRIVERGVLRHSSKHGSFMDLKQVGRLIEIDPGGSLDTLGIVDET